MAQIAGQVLVGAATSAIASKLGGGGGGGSGSGGGQVQSGSKEAGSEMYYPDLPGFTVAETTAGTLPDTSLQAQAALWDIANKQAEYNQYVSAELDRTTKEFYTGQDIRRQQAVGTEDRLGYMVQGQERRADKRVQGQEDRAFAAEQGAQKRAQSRVTGEEERANIAEQGVQQRASARVAGEESRAGMAESGVQDRATRRVGGEEERAALAESGTQQRASARVAGEESRAGMAESGTQSRATRRVEGEEVRATDLQREQFRRYKEARDYGQAQSAYKA